MTNYGIKKGKPPGSYLYVGEEEIDSSEMTLIHKDNNSKTVSVVVPNNVEELISQTSTNLENIVFVTGKSDAKTVIQICENYKIHPLVIEDILNTNQRPKLEFFEKYLSVHFRVFLFDENVEEDKLTFVSYSIILLDKTLLIFSDSKINHFESIVTNLKQGKPIYYKWGLEFILFSLLDYSVDQSLDVLNRINLSIEEIEDRILDLDEGVNSTLKVQQTIHEHKSYLIELRNSVWPIRDLISKLRREQHSLLSEALRVYWSDVYDHTIQLIDLIETSRDHLSGLRDLYMSYISNRMNEVMKTLTVIATIFIPLTFLTSLYGMNFYYMPELSFQYGYFVLWIGMIIILLIQLYYFRRKGWM